MESSRAQFLSPPALPAPAGYSHVASVAPGRIVWVSGQVAIDADGTAAPPGDWAAQTRLAFENVGRALEAAGAAWADVVKLTFFVTDVSALARSARFATSSSTRSARRRARSCRSRG